MLSLLAASTLSPAQPHLSLAEIKPSKCTFLKKLCELVQGLGFCSARVFSLCPTPAGLCLQICKCSTNVLMVKLSPITILLQQVFLGGGEGIMTNICHKKCFIIGLIEFLLRNKQEMSFVSLFSENGKLPCTFPLFILFIFKFLQCSKVLAFNTFVRTRGYMCICI